VNLIVNAMRLVVVLPFFWLCDHPLADGLSVFINRINVAGSIPAYILYGLSGWAAYFLITVGSRKMQEEGCSDRAGIFQFFDPGLMFITTLFFSYFGIGSNPDLKYPLPLVIVLLVIIIISIVFYNLPEKSNKNLGA